MNNLIAHKSSMTKRRLIIIFILCTILTVSIMTGFSSGLDSDSTIYTAEGERLVMWAELPESGTPEDYDAFSSVKYAAQKLYMASYFKGESRGDVVANVGMGIKYTQHVHNVRVVKGDEIFQEAVSASTLKSVADQLYFKGDNTLYRPASKISGDSAVFSDTVYKLSSDDYYSRYGAKPNELTKYAINDKTVLEVVDGNAAVKSAANSNGEEPSGGKDEGITIPVPDSLTPDADGNYRVILTLDPVESPKYYRNEVRTRGGADQNPVFYYVHLTLVMSSDFTPVTLTCEENYDIAIPGLGAMNCTSSITETFTDYNTDGEVPEHDFFEQHIDASTIDVPLEQPKTPADYLSSAFAAYLDGSKNLDLRASVGIDGLDKLGVDIENINIPELFVSVNIKTMNIRAKLDDLYIEYAGDKVYITKGDIKGYFTVDAFAAAIKSDQVQKLLSGSNVKLPDFGSLLGGDIISTVFANCELTTADGIACVRLPFSLGGIDIDASLYIKDADMSLVSISGTVKAFGLDVKLAAEPAACEFPAPDETYSDMSSLAGFIPDAIATFTDGAVDLVGSLSIGDTTVGIDAYVDITNIYAPVIDGTLDVLGLDVSIKYIGGTVYLQCGDIKAKTTVADITELVPVITELLGSKLSSLDIESLFPSNFKVLDVLGSLSVTDEKFDIGLKLFGDIGLSLTRADGMLTGVSLDAALDLPMLETLLGIKLDAKLSRAETATVAATGDYINVKDLLPAVDAIYAVIDKKAVAADFDITVDGMNINGALALDFSDGLALNIKGKLDGAAFDATLIDGTLYVSIGEIKLCATIADANTVITALDGIIPAATANTIDKVLGIFADGEKSAAPKLDIEKIAGKIVDAIKLLAMDNGTLTANIAIGDVTVDASIANALTDANVTVSIKDTQIFAKLSNIAAGAVVTAPDATEYVVAEKFVGLVKPIVELATAEGYRFALSGNIYGIDISNATLTIKLPTPATETQKAEGLALSLDATLGDVGAHITLANDKLYIKLGNGIALVTGTTEPEITALVQKLQKSVPELAELISGMPAIDVDTTKLTVTDILGAIKAFDKTANGVNIAIDATAFGIDASMTLELAVAENGISVTLGGNAFGLTIDGATVGVTVDGGKATAAQIKYADIATLAATVESLDAQEVTAPNAADYVSLDVLADLVKPIYALVKDAMTARSIGLDLAVTLLDDKNNATAITGKLNVSLDADGNLDGLGATLKLFAGTKNETDLEITYVTEKTEVKVTEETETGTVEKTEVKVSGKIYIKVENILLSVDLVGDKTRLLSLLNEYLPKYLVDKIGEILSGNGSVLSAGSGILGGIGTLMNANGASEIINVLFDKTNGDSMLKTLVDMVKLAYRNGEVSVALDVMGFNITATPHVVSDALSSLTLGANIKSTNLTANASNLVISSTVSTISAPDNAAKYVSIMDIAEIVNNLVHNFTTPDADGNITFEIKTFGFTYTTKDTVNADGTTTPGNKIEVKNTDGKSALKGKIKPIKSTDKKTGKEKTTYEIQLEAHIDLTIDSMKATYGTLGLSLYVVNGAAYLDYQERNTGYGERVSIDFASVMQILCSVMQIMDVDPDVIEELVGDYKTDIDPTFFKSMKIAGLDNIKDMIESLAGKIQTLTGALNDFETTWAKIETAGSMENLDAQWEDTIAKDGKTVKGIKSELLDILGKIKTILPEKSGNGTGTAVDVPALIHGIATGVKLSKDGNDITAAIDNSLTVPGTTAKDPASIVVTQNKQGDKMIVDGFTISNLDVDSAMIEGNGSFAAGITLDDITVPESATTTEGNTTYSNLADIKRLIFDLMNTANLGEFEIGTHDGATVTESQIQLDLNIRAITDLIERFGGTTTITIPYNVKVMLVDQGQDAQPRYKTAAVVELLFDNIEMVGAVVAPNCTTRLYFYDNQFYIQGMRWYKDEYTKKHEGVKDWKWQTWYTQETGNATYEPVFVHYTLDEFLGLFNDLPTFMEKCLFYLLPLSIDFTFLHVNLQTTIIDAVKPSDSSTTTQANPTIANVFNGYSYADGKHSVSLSLANLTGNSTFGNIDLSITGQNDDDDATTGNLLNNYISALDLNTKINGDMVVLTLKASLINAQCTDDNTKVHSKGLGTINPNGAAYRLYKTSSPAVETGYNHDDIINDYILNSSAVTWTPFETVKGWAQFEDLVDKTNKIN